MPARQHRRNDMLIAGVALLIVGLLLTVLEYFALDQRQRLELRTQAELVARTASAAVVFDSAIEARDILSAFDRSPEVRSARLLRAADDELARYERAEPPRGWLDRHGGATVVAADVVANGRAGRATCRRCGARRLVARDVDERRQPAGRDARRARLRVARVAPPAREGPRRRRALALPRTPRSAHRAGQPRQLRGRTRAHAGPGRRQRDAARRCCAWTSTTSNRSTTPHGHAAGDVVLQTVAAAAEGLAARQRRRCATGRGRVRGAAAGACRRGRGTCESRPPSSTNCRAAST